MIFSYYVLFFLFFFSRLLVYIFTIHFTCCIFRDCYHYLFSDLCSAAFHFPLTCLFVHLSHSIINISYVLYLNQLSQPVTLFMAYHASCWPRSHSLAGVFFHTFPAGLLQLYASQPAVIHHQTTAACSEHAV